MRSRIFSAGFLACGLAATMGCKEAARTPQPNAKSPPIQPTAAPVHLPSRVTFSEHIAPIVYSSCAKCHRPGAAGPFPLLSYQDVASRAELIRSVTASKYMPPWPADGSFRHFAGENVLTDEQIQLIGRWVEQGAPLGDRRRLRPAPRFPKGSQLGKPDLVVRMPTPYLVRGDNIDHFVSMKLPFAIPRDTFVRAIEFVPGNRKVVHHVNAHLVNYADGAKRSLLKGPWFVEAGPMNMDPLDELDIRNDDGTAAAINLSVTNYLPGALPTLYPEGIGGFRMSKRGYLLLHHIHYGPTSTDQVDRSYFNVFFDKAPPRRPTYTLLLGTLGRSPVVPQLIIPPDSIKTFHTQFQLPADISVLTINPHMHLLGRRFLAYAVSPQGDTIPLVRINNWDFRWQYFYTFNKILVLRKGTTIYAEGTYDNTTGNPRNPFSPPREVREQGGSMKSTDEMFQCIITMLPYQSGDENISLEDTS